MRRDLNRHPPIPRPPLQKGHPPRYEIENDSDFLLHAMPRKAVDLRAILETAVEMAEHANLMGETIQDLDG